MPRIFFLISSGFVLLQTLTCCTEERDPKLNSIIAAYQKREDSDDSVQAHLAWLESDAGRDEAAYLAEHYDLLTENQKYDIPTELARTALPAIVPLVKKSLSDPKSNGRVMPGIFYGCFLAGAETAYRHALAPAVVPWIGKGSQIGKDSAIELLPALDADLAARTFFTDEFLSVDASQVHFVLRSLNDAGVETPLPRIWKILEAWEVSAIDPKAEYRVQAGYREAVRALALHDAREALEIAERIIQQNPQESDNYDEIPLAAAGLTRLYENLCDHTEDPVKFSQLPEAAQIYFAVAYFESDSSNGGYSQAFGNSTGDYFSLVKKGYQAIGDTRSLRFVEHMCQPFGPAGPSPNRDQRNKQMESMKPSYWEQEEALREVWEKKSGDQPYISTSWLLNLYAAKNAAILKPFVKEAIR